MRRKTVQGNQRGVNLSAVVSPFLPSVGPAVALSLHTHTHYLSHYMHCGPILRHGFSPRFVVSSKSFPLGNLHTRISATFRRKGLNMEDRLTCIGSL